MPNRKYKKIFQTNNEALQEMLYLYKIHKLSIEDLAKKFDVDHTSIVYQLRKHSLHIPTEGSPFSIKNKKKVLRPRTKTEQIPKNKLKQYWEKLEKEEKTKILYSKILYEPICEGKSYKKYLENELNKKALK